MDACVLKMDATFSIEFILARQGPLLLITSVPGNSIPGRSLCKTLNLTLTNELGRWICGSNRVM